MRLEPLSHFQSLFYGVNKIANYNMKIDPLRHFQPLFLV